MHYGIENETWIALVVSRPFHAVVSTWELTEPLEVEL